MNKRKMILLLVGCSVFVLLILGSVAARQIFYTPLYMVRMEQASSRMNFLPTEVNEFAYAAGAGYTLSDIQGCCGGITPNVLTFGSTCDGTCTEPTCPDTCRLTCDDPTCANTCPATCPLTCDTCSSTCTTCGGTCYITCFSTCFCITY